MSEHVVILSDATFRDEIESATEPYLVDFWANWCTPCLALEPIIDELADEQVGKLRVGRMNIIDHPETPGQLGITTIPAMFVFKDGELVKRIFGARGKRQLLVELEAYLS